MQRIVRVFGTLLLTVAAAASLSAGPPLFLEKSPAYTNKVIGLYALNNAGDILASIPENDGPQSWGESPALIRGGRAISLVPTGIPNLDSLIISGLSERRDDGVVYVAGTARMKDGFWRAALWEVAANGAILSFRTMPNIFLPPDSSAPGEQRRSYGVAVNTSGVLVGSGESYLAGLATIWRPPYQHAVRYLLSTGSEFSAIAEDDFLAANGVEFEHGGANNRYAAAVLYEGGIPGEVPLLKGTPATLYPNRIASFRGEWVAGYNHLAATTRGFAWKIGTPASFELPAPQSVAEQNSGTQASSINSSGHAVGYANDSTPIYWHFNNGAFQAWSLNELLPDEPYAGYRVEQTILNNNESEVVFLTRDWSGSRLKVYQPLTNGVVSFSQANAWVEEGSEMEFRIKLVRVEGNNAPVSVEFGTADDTATSPADYAGRSGTITWNTGEAGEKAIRVATKDDLVLRGERSMKVLLTDATGARVGSVDQATGYIYEPVQQFFVRNLVTVGGWMQSCAVLQGQKQAVIKVGRAGGTDGSITFTNFQAAGFGAKEGVDFQLPSGLSLSWAAGDASIKTIRIPLLNTEEPISEAKSFSLTASGKFDGTEIESFLSLPVSIQPSVEDSQPVIDLNAIQDLVQSLSLTIRAIQGATVRLEQTLGGLSNWTTAAQVKSNDGEVEVLLPIDSQAKAAFFRVKVEK